MVIRETLNGFQGGLKIGRRIVTKLRYANNIILLATSEGKLQELMDRLDHVSRKYNLHINVVKTKVMASDSVAWQILIQNEQLEQMDTFPYLRSLITEDGEWMMACCTRLNKGQAIGGITAENIVKSQHIDFNKDMTNESASVACSKVWLWKLSTQKEWRNTSWRLWVRNAASFVDSKENKWVGP